MISYIYLSEAQTDFNNSELEKLAEQSAARNKSLGITGYLWFRNNQFIQYIEGPAFAVTMMMMTTELDERHQVHLSRLNKEQKERLFPKWHMKLFDDSSNVQFRMESLVEMNLNMLKTANDKDSCTKLLWKQIKTLAQQHHLMH